METVSISTKMKMYIDFYYGKQYHRFENIFKHMSFFSELFIRTSIIAQFISLISDYNLN